MLPLSTKDRVWGPLGRKILVSEVCSYSCNGAGNIWIGMFSGRRIVMYLCHARNIQLDDPGRE